MPGPLIAQRDIATAAVTPQKRVFDDITGKAREARVFFYFASTTEPVSMPHALGRTPTQWRLAKISREAGAPGTVYTPVSYGSAPNPIDAIYSLTKNHIVLQCTTANTWAEVIIS